MPPPNARPVTPVVPTTPPGVTRPNTWVEESKSSHVAPPCERAILASASTSTLRISERSITSPSSMTQCPAGLWPPPANCNLESVRPGKIERRRNITCTQAADDQLRTAVDRSVEADPRRFVGRITPGKYAPGHRSSQLDDAIGGRLGLSRGTHVPPIETGGRDVISLQRMVAHSTRADSGRLAWFGVSHIRDGARAIELNAKLDPRD